MKANNIFSSKVYRDSARKNADIIQRVSEKSRINRGYNKVGSVEKELVMIVKKTA